MKSTVGIKLIIQFIFTINFALSLVGQAPLSGKPFIENYSKEEYKAGAQNWDSALMENGHIFMANNSGLLEFDGYRWSLHRLPNGSINRSVYISDIGRIYVGGQDEIGYFYPNSTGVLTFTSIREFIPQAYLPLQDVWKIIYHQDKVYFLSVNRVYVYQESTNELKVIDPESPVISIIRYKNKVYYFDLFNGVITLDGNNTKMLNSDQLKEFSILNIIDIDGRKTYISAANGMFQEIENRIVPVQSKLNDFLKINNVFNTYKSKNGEYILGTIFGGIVQVDTDGTIIQIIDKDQGLTNNNAHTVLQKSNGDLWVGTSNGIDLIKLNSPLRILNPDNNGDGTFYDIEEHNGDIYFGSNNGLYTHEANNEYAMIPNSQGQVWGLSKVGDQLFMGHNRGAFQIINGSADLISQVPGAWKFLPANNEDEIYVGTYEGVDIYKRSGKQWSFHKKLEGFIESSRIMISVKPMEIWVSHPYRGVYRITHDNEYFVTKVELYDESKGLPSKLLNYIFNINGVPYVTGKTGVYYYDRDQNQFVLDQELSQKIGDSKNVKRLYLQGTKMWYIAENEVGYLSMEVKKDYEKTIIHDLRDVFVPGFEKLFFSSDSVAFACSDDEVLAVDIKANITQQPPHVFINKVTLMSNRDSILFGGYSATNDSIRYQMTDAQIPQLPYLANELLFEYSSPSHPYDILYSYTLAEQGDPQEWSSWSKSISKEYNNLNYGSYLFSVKAKSASGNISKQASYQFRILPPWYKSNAAIFLYWLLILAAVAALFFIPKKKYEKEKELLTTAIEESEGILEKVKTEKLEAEISFKNSELASSTMHLVQKNETITKVRQEVQNVAKNIKDPQAKKEIRKILSLFKDDERLEEDWEKFSGAFDQVHTDFLKRISATYPQLTPKDKKLCAYLRMNLSTKEIAPLLNISIRGVEISRYRLRKKIELEGSINLNEFMMGF